MTAMTYGAWLCLLAPLGATILILLCGTRIPRVAAAWISTTSVFVAFAGAIWAFVGVHQSHPGQFFGTSGGPNPVPARGEITTAWTCGFASAFERSDSATNMEKVRDRRFSAYVLEAVFSGV